MGKTKSKSIRKTAKTLINEGIQFSKDFKKNKEILKSLTISKKQRNQMAGLLARTKAKEKPGDN